MTQCPSNGLEEIMENCVITVGVFETKIFQNFVSFRRKTTLFCFFRFVSN